MNAFRFVKRNNGSSTVALAAVVLLATAGCNKTADISSNYKTAINTYYSAHPNCLWNSPKKFPVQAGRSDTDKTSDFDALVDQGLLTRTTAEKRVFIIASEQVTDYDISDKGRGAWTADPQLPGFGDFCYGHRTVSTINSASENNGQVGASTVVDYRYIVVDVPGWASAAETQNTYPQLKADLAGPQAARTTLTNTSNGWVLTSPSR